VSFTVLVAAAQDLSGEAQDEPGTPAGSDTPGGSDDGDFDKYLQARSSSRDARLKQALQLALCREPSC